MNQPNAHKHAIVRKLSIRRYRGLESLDWRPDPTLNLVLGGGDVGKTTILDAVGLLLSASNATTVSETDYWRRDNTTEFSIEGVVSLPKRVDPNSLSVLLMPWEWNGQDAVLPGNPQDGDVAEATNPVYRLRVRGTPDLELVWEVVQPDDSTIPLSAAFRKKIGLIRLSADDRKLFRGRGVQVDFQDASCAGSTGRCSSANVIASMSTFNLTKSRIRSWSPWVATTTAVGHTLASSASRSARSRAAMAVLSWFIRRYFRSAIASPPSSSSSNAALSAFADSRT